MVKLKRHIKGLKQWFTILIAGLVLVAALADILANDKPLVSSDEDGVSFPVFQQMGIDLGVIQPPLGFVGTDWQGKAYRWVVWAPVPYSPGSFDRRNKHFVSPLDKQDVESIRFRHWLGTDLLGRDVLSGLIHGTRMALLVGFFSVLISGLLGLLLGAFSGYFGNQGLKTSWWIMIAGLFWLFAGLYLGHYSDLVSLSLGWWIIWAVGFVLWFFMLPQAKGTVQIPIDGIVLRLMELIQSVPGLLVLMTVLALVQKPGTWTVVLVIGLLSWPGVARFARAEMLKVRSMTFMDATRVMGMSHFQIIMRHGMVNIFGSVTVILAFNFAGAILAESALSFIGVGLDPSEVTWGNMLNAARTQPSAWWVAVFPGVLLFLTILSLNRLGSAWEKSRGVVL